MMDCEYCPWHKSQIQTDLDDGLRLLPLTLQSQIQTDLDDGLRVLPAPDTTVRSGLYTNLTFEVTEIYEK